MKRLTTGLIALVVFAAACGSGDDAEDVFATLGLSDAEAACFETEFAARDLDMDALLTADREDLSSEELQSVLDVSAACAGTAERTAADDDTGDDDTSEEPSDDETAGDDAPADDAGDTGDDESTDEPSTDDDDESTSDGPRRDYDDLNGFEQAFVDGLVQSGGTVEIGICMLDEFDAAGISILELAELGLDADAEPTSEMLGAILNCGDELSDAGVFDADNLFGGADGTTYGDNPELDALWDACADGDLASCDDLYWGSAIGSDYEAFGSTCGETAAPTFGSCTGDSGFDLSDGDTYGDDPALDALWDACAGGDLGSCDELWFSSSVGSEYEAFAESCGGLTTEEFWGSCEENLGG